MHFARVLGSLAALGLYDACRAAEPEIVDQLGPSRDELVESAPGDEAPATKDPETPRAVPTATGSPLESGTGGGETGVIEAGARLCSRPYSLSGSPGKGSSSRADAGDSSAYEPATRRLRRGLEASIGERPRQAWTTKLGVVFDDLDPSVRHTIKIVDAQGKRMKSLVLDFEARGSEDLCLGFNDFYGSWQLRTLRSGRRCGPCVTR